tara:strand:+ start:196 stop:1206 length:1011 start_codon:yes stop_codon:yes gene_type:complete
MLVYLFFPFALIVSSSLGIIISPTWAVAPFIWVLMIVPIIDLILPNLNKQDNKLNENKLHNIALIIIFPGILFLVFFGLIKVSQNDISYLEAMALGAAVGMSGGSIGITTAHELIHRNNKKMRSIGVMLLIICLYGHFRIEHIYGHHKYFATKQDPATARKGENFYFFLFRCVIMSLVSAWNIEKKLLTNKNLSAYNIRNRMFHYFVAETFLLILAFLIAGINGLIFIFFHSALSIILLELVDYIQHYGLERTKKNGKYETYSEQHSWNSRHTSANWSTFNLGLHAEHHQTANRHYPLLSHQKKIMEMPTNYPVMIMMALIPPIWFRVMNLKLKKN